MLYFCGMNASIKELRRAYVSALEPLYGHREAVAMMDLLLDKCFGISKMDFMMHEDATLSESQLVLLKSYIEDLMAFRPIQHIIGQVDFCGCVINVSPDVLIPRPETAEMVAMIAGRWSHNPPSRVVDVCTGSGCIAVSLAKRFPQSRISALELSQKALEQASANADINKVEVDFVHADILNPSTRISHQTVDLIVSNPPYICDSERHQMHRNVLDYEPDMALFVPDDDSMLFYRAILRKSTTCLSDKGEVWFELNETKQQEMRRLCEELGFSAEFYMDINGKCRFCRAWIDK